MSYNDSRIGVLFNISDLSPIILKGRIWGKIHARKNVLKIWIVGKMSYFFTINWNSRNNVLFFSFVHDKFQFQMLNAIWQILEQMFPKSQIFLANISKLTNISTKICHVSTNISKVRKKYLNKYFSI